MRTAAAAEAARAEEERKARAGREAKEQAKKDAVRREATVAGLSPDQITKAEELANWNFIAEREDPTHSEITWLASQWGCAHTWHKSLMGFCGVRLGKGRP
jgi:hypothetical protein